MAVNLLALQYKANFYGFCFICKEPIHPERLARGSDTCCPDHQNQKRRAARRFAKELRQETVLQSPKARRLAIRMEAEKQASGTATEVSNAVC